MNETVDSLLKTTLDSLGFPCERLLCSTQADTYLTFQLVTGQETGFADDDTDMTQYTYMVHIFSKSDYISLIRQLKKSLKAAGFFNILIGAEMYEQDTGYYHIPITVHYLEE